MNDTPASPAVLPLPAAGTVVFADLEYTSWEGAMERGWSGPGELREIVQIGAVRADTGANGPEGFREIAAFSVLVRPTRNPVLSDYFVDLTGITNADVARDGVSLEAAVAAFTAFVGDAPVLSHGRDDVVVAQDCARAGLANPFAGDDWRDIAPAIRAVTGEKLQSGELPARFGLSVKGRAHDALADARALARVLGHLRGAARV
jgi:inhibitor of KinA sporulation pathway (predicted exonuclease)